MTDPREEYSPTRPFDLMAERVTRHETVVTSSRSVHDPDPAGPEAEPAPARASSEPRRYLVNEIYLSVQGEGVRAGTLNVFVRLAKCNMRCAVEPGPRSPGGFDCDTEFESGRRMTAREVLERCLELWPRDHSGSQSVPAGEPWIILTGGEPGLQLDLELADALRGGARGSPRLFNLAIETNGSIELPRLPEHELPTDLSSLTALEEQLACFAVDWITVSPKVAEHAIRQRWAHEVKYVRGEGQAAPQTAVQALHHLVSPAFDGLRLDPGAMATCLEIVRTTPPWRLSVQLHKSWRVR